MAIQIVSGNLNTWGNNGQFETDPSTWGFGSFAERQVSRSSTYHSAGAFSLQTAALAQPAVDIFPVAFAKANLVAGKKYLLKAKVMTRAADPIAEDNVVVRIEAGFFSPIADNISYEISQTIADIKDASAAPGTWFDLETRFDAVSTGNISDLFVGLVLDPMDADGDEVIVGASPGSSNQIYVDQFEVYEYIDVVEEPPPSFQKAFWSKNPVTFGKNAPVGWEMLTNFRLYDDVRVEDEAGSGVYNSKLKVAQPPASDGSVLFSVRSAFRDVLNPIPPDHNEGNILRLTDRIKYFKHFTGQLQDDEVVPAALDESDSYLVLLGGLSTLKWPVIDFFGAYLAANKKFLTWAPVEKLVDRLQEDYLNFWVYSALIATIKVRIKAYYDDDTSETSTIHTENGVVHGYLYQIPAGPANSGVLNINPAKNLVKYELDLLDQDDAVISEVRTFVIVQTRHPRTRFFMFLNSLGAFEVHRFTGVGVQTAEYSGEPFERYLPPDYTEDDIQLDAGSVVFQNKASFSTGHIKGRYAEQWLAYFRDMLLTPKFLDVTTGARVPMVILTRQMQWREDQNFERFVRFEAAEAFFNESHTPEEI